MNNFNFFRNHIILFGILLVALVIRLVNLGTPPEYYFDEVYHAVTAKAYAINNPAGYEWWHNAPEPGTAYEWLHPPIAKLFMAISWKFLGQTAWAWRFPGVIFGLGVIALTYWVSLLLIKNKKLSQLAAFFASVDGLLLAQSRVGMNDIYVTFFMLASVGAYIKSRAKSEIYLIFDNPWIWLSGLCAGLAMSTKWSGVFTIGMIGTWELVYWYQLGSNWLKRLPALIVIFGLLPLATYVLSYGQFWLQGHSVEQFVELHNQIWWYQTHLEATHSYQSKAWEWPLVLRPVWLWVKYFDNDTIANIYNLANPLLAWLGLLSIITLLPSVRIFKESSTVNPLHVILGAYAWSWMPWLMSPRIMFFYHYTPAIPWLCIAFAYLLVENENLPFGKEVTIAGITLVTVAFIWLLPIWLGIPLRSDWWPWLFWLSSWK